MGKQVYGIHNESAMLKVYGILQNIASLLTMLNLKVTIAVKGAKVGVSLPCVLGGQTSKNTIWASVAKAP